MGSGIQEEQQSNIPTLMHVKMIFSHWELNYSFDLEDLSHSNPIFMLALLLLQQ